MCEDSKKEPGNTDYQFIFGEVGEEEGSLCNRDGCLGTIELPPVHNCTCFISPPCSACTRNVLTCPVCGWEQERA
jgi:hypothetical protein